MSTTLRWVIGFSTAVVGVTLALAAEASLIDPAHRIDPAAPEWRELANQFSRGPDMTADFEERRVFPFRKEAVVLSGEVRVSRVHGLSLHYTKPEERSVILDERGVLVREASGQKAPPADPRASAANDALWHVLRFDFPALAEKFDLYGKREGTTWSLALVPHAEAVKQAIGNIFVLGDGATVRQIVLRRSAKQHIDIDIAPPRASTAFTTDEVRRYFR
jgi:hypothetical protein